jgi:ribosome-binding factor A
LDKSDCAQVLKGLKSASGYLRRELGRALQLRYTPELTFVQDDSIDKGAHILDLLRDPTVVKPANPANEHIHLDEE